MAFSSSTPSVLAHLRHGAVQLGLWQLYSEFAYAIYFDTAKRINSKADQENTTIELV